MSLIKRLHAQTVWHPDGIPSEDWKYRRLVRLWLPLYDVIAVFTGLVGLIFGSPLLNRLFSEPVTDVVTGLFVVVAVSCLVSVSFPALWRMEIASKVLLVGMVVAYIFTILAYGDTGIPLNLFVAGMLAFGLPLALFRLDLLGQDILERRLVEQALAAYSREG
ncbi:membrane protein [Microbacterium phage Rona]|uniref:Uncharacterized protein n=1 Tax=Microbacterium phage Kieran TaxID=2126931 RepID=A0A2R4A2L0_9CAUD|nr:hypothetical protein PBI_KIERAN_21 [Microbacterium phage Kieran]UYL86809.1 membrane protein [Microbacterium phage Rona]